MVLYWIMKVNPSIFRTYDVRGRYPEELNEEVASGIAAAFVKLYPHVRTLLVAHDTRPSSPSLAKAIRDAFQGLGRDVVDLALAPDPLFYYTLFYYGHDGGIMVSGSHNLGSFNGLSMSVKRQGEEYASDVISGELERIKELVEQGGDAEKPAAPGVIERKDPAEEYARYVADKVRLQRPLSVVIDSGNGAMGYLPEKVFAKLGCKVTTLYGEYDGTFPNHVPDPYQEENLKDLKEAVVREQADVGFAYDADGDRVAIVDGRGRPVSGDFAMLMLARQAVEKKKGPVVHDVRVSKAFLDEMARLGVETHFSVSHHNAVIKKIQETKAVFGGEITLHFIFPLDYYPVDDALFASLKLAAIASAQEDFAAFVDSLPRYEASPELFIEVADEKKVALVSTIVSHIKEKGYSLVDVDGARVQLDKGWALLRAANTSPHVKCRFEGETKKDLQEIERTFLALFKQLGVPVTKEHERELGLA
ncbi:MAG: phosphomannomutase/phosphoglucomutase [bacterium]|nr:phosphomannomutase/phosphoglucomutase [bacterium]